MFEENPLELNLLKQWADNTHPDLWETASFMESQEDWLLDNPGNKFLLTCIKIAQVFDTEIKQAGVFIQNNDEKMAFIYGLAYLGTCKSLRLLGLAGQRQPGLGGDIIQVCMNEIHAHSEHQAECNIVFSRIKQIVKMESYRRIFGPERRKSVLQYFNEIREEL